MFSFSLRLFFVVFFLLFAISAVSAAPVAVPAANLVARVASPIDVEMKRDPAPAYGEGGGSNSDWKRAASLASDLKRETFNRLV